MRRILQCTVLAFLAVGATASAAHASTITDTFNPADVFMFTDQGQGDSSPCTGSNDPLDVSDTTSGTTCTSLLYYHDISPLASGLQSATLTLTVYDDEVCNNPTAGCQPQEADIRVDLDIFGTHQYTISDDGLPFDAILTVTSYLLSDNGNLRVLLSVGDLGSGQADFWFDKSVLSATFGDDDNETPLPEPTSLILFGGGLAAVASRIRKRRAHRA